MVELMTSKLIRCGFPAEQLFDMMMRGGPLPERIHNSVGGRLSGSMILELDPQELISMREWVEYSAIHQRGRGSRSAGVCSGRDRDASSGAEVSAVRCEIVAEETRPQQSAFGHRPAGSPETWPEHCSNCGERP